jgi:hypothetical protein
MKLKHSILLDNRLYPVFERLLKEPVTHDLRYKLRRIGAKMDQQQKLHVEFMNSLLAKYGEKGEDGNYILEYQGDGEAKKAVGYKLKDGEAFESAMKAYLNEEFEIEVTPIFATDLKDIKASVNELLVMKPFIADFDNV